MSFFDRLNELMQSHKIFTDDGALSYCLTPCIKPSKILLIAGDNATGKSLICRVAKQVARKENTQCVEISMGDRAKKGYMTQAISFGRYGDEDMESTGFLTINRILKDIEKLSVSEEPFVLIIDEPDIGLSQSYHKALGQLIGQKLLELTALPMCQGLLVVSHAKLVFEGITFINKDNFHGIFMGCKSLSFTKWLNCPTEHKSISELLSLPQRSKDFRRNLEQYFTSK